MNPEYFTLPSYQTLVVVDMLSHVLERYLINTQNVDLTDRLCEAVMQSLIYNGTKVMQDPQNYDVRANLMWAFKLITMY